MFAAAQAAQKPKRRSLIRSAWFAAAQAAQKCNRKSDPDALALARARVDVDDALAREQACRMVLLLRMEEAESLRWRGRNLMSRKTDGGVFVASADTLRKELP